jgi:hypothetical protein
LVSKALQEREFPIATAPKPTMAEVLQLCSYPVVGSPDAPPGVFGLLSIQMASIRPGGHPHGSGMGICASGFLWRLRGSATMFPKDKRMFPASQTEMSIGFRLFLEGLHLVKSYDLLRVFVFAYQDAAPYHKGLLIRMVVEQEPKILNDRTTSMQVRMGY